VAVVPLWRTRRDASGDDGREAIAVASS
jgi:hypothetical protein